ncbi:hypothetical protein LC087_02630 [Bacillus carboniphilus]|uniref:CARDB domain-containing protein n=1 Tax=Bacillus carboniphilus TaxID=86663 RepID=A0ABY9JUR4_9BACI|nr:hypothetical protein [Bacillus carboniphilus]WLR43122.1 hypothetical protein LC087_02630 [Bacillus carboniphilus]
MPSVVFCSGPFANPSLQIQSVEVIVRNTSTTEAVTATVRLFDESVQPETLSSSTVVNVPASLGANQAGTGSTTLDVSTLTKFAIDIRVDAATLTQNVIATAVQPGLTLLDSSDEFIQYERNFVCRPRRKILIDFGD